MMLLNLAAGSYANNIYIYNQNKHSKFWVLKIYKSFKYLLIKTNTDYKDL